MLVIPVPGKRRQGYQKFKVISSYVLETCLKKKKKNSKYSVASVVSSTKEISNLVLSILLG